MEYKNITRTKFIFYDAQGVKTVINPGETIDSARVAEVATHNGFVSVDRLQESAVTTLPSGDVVTSITAQAQYNTLMKRVASLEANLESAADKIVQLIKDVDNLKKVTPADDAPEKESKKTTRA